ncbi:hypothetical protein HDU91_005839 [Kappamyces sp. JEL0680]|nr:hypothetical protein HDU91_005839 [Kappamyces sp. JEL0680]
MSASKSEGYKDQAIGAMKENIGGLFSEKARADGAAQRAQGEAEVTAAKTANRAEAAHKNLQGGFEKIVGGITGDTAKKAQGHAHAAEGDVIRESNRF